MKQKTGYKPQDFYKNYNSILKGVNKKYGLQKMNTKQSIKKMHSGEKRS